jgi:hypothetical protein
MTNSNAETIIKMGVPFPNNKEFLLSQGENYEYRRI